MGGRFQENMRVARALATRISLRDGCGGVVVHIFSDDPAVEQMNYAVRILGLSGFMRHHGNGGAGLI